MPNTKLITLTIDDMKTLINEKPIKREGYCISSKASLLAILAILEEELQKLNVKSNIA